MSVPNSKPKICEDSDPYLIMGRWGTEGVIKVLHNLIGYFFPLPSYIHYYL